eukprot:941269_1
MASNKQQMAVQLKSYWTSINKLHETDKLHSEYFSCFGNKIISSKNNTMITNAKKSTIDGWNTAYGEIDIIPRKNKTYFWAIAITQQHSQYNGSVAVGIDENICKHIDTYFHGQTTTINYAYKSDGKKYSNTCVRGFSDPYISGDIVLIMLKGYTLSFSKINLEMCEKKQIKSMDEYIKYGQWIVAERQIDSSKTYKFAVSVYGKTALFGKEDQHMTSVQLLKYKFIITDYDYDDDYQSHEIIYNKAPLYDEEKKYDIDEDTFKFKTKLISMDQQLTNMERIYNKRALSNEFEKTPHSLMVSEEINKLKIRLRTFGKYLNNVEQHVSDLITPDVCQYKTWNIGQIIQWISLLDNGAYNSYLGVLRRGFKSDNICNGEKLCELQRNDLRCSPFNIKDFDVRTKLAQHFLSLQNNKSKSKMHSFYGGNGYNPHYNSNPPSAPYQ